MGEQVSQIWVEIDTNTDYTPWSKTQEKLWHSCFVFKVELKLK